jgi:hypothetical protein
MSLVRSPPSILSIISVTEAKLAAVFNFSASSQPITAILTYMEALKDINTDISG